MKVFALVDSNKRIREGIILDDGKIVISVDGMVTVVDSMDDFVRSYGAPIVGPSVSYDMEKGAWISCFDKDTMGAVAVGIDTGERYFEDDFGEPDDAKTLSC